MTTSERYGDMSICLKPAYDTGRLPVPASFCLLRNVIYLPNSLNYDKNARNGNLSLFFKKLDKNCLEQAPSKLYGFPFDNEHATTISYRELSNDEVELVPTSHYNVALIGMRGYTNNLCEYAADTW